ncbi:hypothetical protein BSL84_13705 [Streptomyces sp. TN58]|nr:hypothetical protein BSL84_13705 [Streptomyces sp. TN58]
MSRLGRPLRDESRTAATATSSTSEQTSRSSLSVWTVSGRPSSMRPVDRSSRRQVRQVIRYLT